MLRARRRGVFRRDYEIESDGGPVTTLAGARREGCAYALDSAEYRVERDGRKRFVLHGPGGRVATAERMTRREWAVRAQTGNVQLVKPSMWRSGWEIHQRGSARGTIRHDGVFSRSFAADLPSDVPLPVRVFALYVVLVNYEREANAAAGV
ncbi:hypothetical protein [Actinophytocola algeriensis]|uniref:Uncharacterized protein n=1 Tax=Actinophytocola algeriensis TaxID=1768010 RepID=A0A7W7QD95_9PSEU|nr:hypothetical protein [Actinophytocola algeriensis]MBB4911439.1 hypothetical protein [Actinophytocola algeriensis]MBE1479378.1 hypothetical protein [Actinophytocola algeriensis]